MKAPGAWSPAGVDSLCRSGGSMEARVWPGRSVPAVDSPEHAPGARAARGLTLKWPQGFPFPAQMVLLIILIYVFPWSDVISYKNPYCGHWLLPP